MTVSVCIPIFNESAAVEKCAVSLYEKMSSLRLSEEWDFEIIFSDDGSTDDCREKVEDYAVDKKEIKVIGYSGNRGKGSAVREAVLSSTGDVVLFTDCDLAYGADIIYDGVKNIVGGNGDFHSDIVIGSRNLTKDGYNGYGFFRKFASRVYIRFLSLIGGFGLSDSQCGFKVFNAESAKKIFALCKCDGFAFDYEVILIAKKLGMKVAEMPVKIINHRESKVHVVRESLSMVKDIFKIKRRISKLNIARG